MTDPCNLVVERLALGEPLADVAPHVATCARCRRVVEASALLGGTHRDAEPGLGFASRMTAGAQERLVIRRRRRIAGGIVGVALVASLAAFVVARPGASSDGPATAAIQPTKATEPTTSRDAGPDQPTPHHHGQVDDDVATLVHLANVDRSRSLSARWARIEKSLSPYRALVAHAGATP
jgi:hypothetical protein